MQCEDVANVLVMKTLPHSIENITDDKHKYSACSNWFVVLWCGEFCCVVSGFIDAISGFLLW